MQYFFILGNNPALSVAEISSVFPDNKTSYLLSEDVFILEEKEIDCKKLIKKLGGTIKIGKIVEETDRHSFDKIQAKIIKILPDEVDGKFKFGFSYYGKGKLNIKILGMETKKFLKEKGLSCRWVISKEKTLSSVVVEQNKLTSRGLEIVLIDNGNKITIGKTLAVQPFKELSFRDYGRQARDDKSGMIPPKLAQIMINLAGAKQDSTLLDPFCGSGTILMEASLMGIHNLIGSDLSSRAIEDTKTNTAWVRKNLEVREFDLELFNQSAAAISKKIEAKTVDAIVTEPYLGPQRGQHDITKTISELNTLYSRALFEFSKILKKDGTVVMIWPIFMRNGEQNFMNPNVNTFRISRPLPKNINMPMTNRNTIIYGREGQRVFREIVVLKLK